MRFLDINVCGVVLHCESPVPSICITAVIIQILLQMVKCFNSKNLLLADLYLKDQFLSLLSAGTDTESISAAVVC